MEFETPIENNMKCDTSVMNRNIYQYQEDASSTNIGDENIPAADNPQTIIQSLHDQNQYQEYPQQNQYQEYPQQNEIFHQPKQNHYEPIQYVEQNVPYQMHQNAQQQFQNNFPGYYDQRLSGSSEHQHDIPPEQNQFTYQHSKPLQFYNQQDHYSRQVYEAQGPGGVYYPPYQPEYQHLHGRGYHNNEYGHQGFHNALVYGNNTTTYQVIFTEHLHKKDDIIVTKELLVVWQLFNLGMTVHTSMYTLILQDIVFFLEFVIKFY